MRPPNYAARLGELRAEVDIALLSLKAGNRDRAIKTLEGAITRERAQSDRDEAEAEAEFAAWKEKLEIDRAEDLTKSS